jgi:prophage regulatory protein
MEKTGLSKSTMYQEIDLGKFPKPVHLSARTVGWLESEVDDWIQARKPKTRKTSSN